MENFINIDMCVCTYLFLHQVIIHIIIRIKVICKYILPIFNGENYHLSEIMSLEFLLQAVPDKLVFTHSFFVLQNFCANFVRCFSSSLIQTWIHQPNQPYWLDWCLLGDIFYNWSARHECCYSFVCFVLQVVDDYYLGRCK